MKRFLVLFIAVFALMVWANDQKAHAAPATAAISGKVIETMDSGGYTYVRLEKDGKKTWVAVPQMKVVKGKNMSFQPGVVMENFESKTLKRKFDRIIFSGGPVKSEAPAKSDGPAKSEAPAKSKAPAKSEAPAK